MKFLVYDTGMSVEHAMALVKEGHSVRYFTPWNSNFPSFLDYSPGLGMPGLTKVLHFWDNVDWADCVAFFDTGSGDAATYLRKRGKRVFGAGLEGEGLENHRFDARERQSAYGLPTHQTWRVKGTTELRKFLAGKRELIIKHDIFRGDLETIHVKDSASADQLINDIEQRFGPWHDSAFFTVEEKLNGIEPGFDCFFSPSNGFLTPYLWGYESGHAYIGTVSDELPTPLKLIADKMTPMLSKMDYRGAISTEAIVEKDGTPYVIDYTARMPFPLSMAYPNLYQRYADLVFGVAGDEKVSLHPRALYVSCLPLSSEYVKDHWLGLDIDAKVRGNVKTLDSCMVNGRVFCTRGPTNIVNIVAIGDSINALIDSTAKTIDGVSAHGLEGKAAIGSLENLAKIIKEGEEDYGLDFTGKATSPRHG